MKSYKKLIYFGLLFLFLNGIPFILKVLSNQYYKDQTGKYLSINIDEDLKSKVEQNINSKYIYLFTTDKTSYQPYEKIVFSVNIIDKDQKKIVSNISPQLIVNNDQGNKLQNIFSQNNFIMTFDTNSNSFKYELYLKDVDYIGKVTAILTFPDIPILELHKQNLEFIIHRNTPKYPIPYYNTFLGLDSKELLSLRKILSTKGKEVSFAQISAWLKILNTDTVMIPAAITKSYDNDIHPWSTNKLIESEKIAASFHKDNTKVAFWIQALQIEGSNTDKYNYSLTKYTGKNFSQDTFISLSDKERHNQLKKITAEFMSNNNVSFIGFSKVFFDKNYTDTKLQNEFKQSFVTDQVSMQPFELWKEYKEVEYFRQILSSAPSTKPTFFIFDDEELIHNPRFIDMAFASGIDFVFIDINSSILKIGSYLNRINKYKGLDKYQNRLIFSYCLNYNNLVIDQAPVIDNWINKSLKLYNKYNSSAIRIKDFYRAMFGNRGAYPAYEWMLAIGDLTTQWKQQKEVLPLKQYIIANTSIISNEVEFIIELQNISLSTITNIQISLLPLIPDMNFNPIVIKELKSGLFFRTNIVFSDMRFKQILLKKKARYIAFHTLFTQKKQYNMVRLISFIDPNVDVDQHLVVENNFNDQMQLLEIENEQEEVKIEKEEKKKEEVKIEKEEKKKEEVKIEKEEKKKEEVKIEKEEKKKEKEEKKSKKWGVRKKSKKTDEE